MDSRILNKAILIVSLMAAFSPVQSYADSPPGSPEETMIATALMNNPGLRAQRQKIAAMRLVPVQARALPDPTVELELMNFEIPYFKPWDAFGSMINLNYAQVLPAAGKRRAAGEEALREVEMEEARLAVMESELRGEILAAAYRLATVKILLEIKDQVQQALEASAQTATAAYSVGRGNQADVLLAQAEITRIPIERQDLFRQREVARARLDSLLGETADREILDRIRLPEPAPLPPLSDLLKDLEEKAPEIQMAKTGEYVQEGRVEVVKKNFKPDWMVGAGVRIRDMSMGGGTFLTFRLGLTLPFMHHRDRYVPALEESMRMRDSLLSETRQAVVSSRYKLVEAYESAARSERTYGLYRDGLLLQSRLAYESTLAAYSAQKADFNALIQVLTGFYAYQGDQVMAQGDFQESRAMLEAVLGHPIQASPVFGHPNPPAHRDDAGTHEEKE
jgi:outer membrane protein TolC